MLLDFIATIAAGFAAAGLALIANHLSGRRLPRWIVFVVAGGAMLAFSIWNEYSWYPRVVAQLPDTVVIASAPADRVIYRPWTYIFPLVTRLVAVDRGAAVHSASDPALLVASAVVIQRWAPTRRLPVAFDCAKGARADLTEGAALGDNGTLTGAEWREVGKDDALLMAACGGA
jgi:hypothetical protein